VQVQDQSASISGRDAALRSTRTLGGKGRSDVVVRLKTSTLAWTVVHLIAVTIWLQVVSPLWRVGSEQRCPDFGDSLLLKAVVLPSMAAGLIIAIWGLVFTYLKRTLPARPASLVAWSCLTILWIVAAAYAYWRIRHSSTYQC
jgi:hypothetical protein